MSFYMMGERRKMKKEKDREQKKEEKIRRYPKQKIFFPSEIFKIMKKVKGTGLLLFALALFSSCLGKNEKIYTKTVEDLFDTVHVISGYDKSEKDFSKKVEFYKKEMEELHNLYTSYEDIEKVNNIKTINDNAGVKPVKVDKRIIALLKDSIKWNREISNKVNIAAGGVIQLWEKGRQEKRIPNHEELERAKKCSNIDNIVIDEENSTVFLKEKCTRINVGAVAKGYAVEIVAAKMKKEGMDSIIISAGGNVKVIGKRKIPKKEEEVTDLKSCKTDFCIGIMTPIYNDKELDNGNPYKRRDIPYISKIAVSDTSVVTTGSYQRYSVIEGKVYGHIINMDTMYPEEKFSSVTVITENSGLADFMSTTLYLLSFEEGKNLLVKLRGIGRIDAIWAMKSGNIETTESIVDGEDYVKYDFK